MVNMYTFKLDFGDWSGDGHSQSDSIIFETNKEIQELREHYFQNCEKYGNILENICSEYQQSSISRQDADKLFIAGIDISPELKENIANDTHYYVNLDEFIDWFIQFMKLDSPDLILERVEEERMPTFHFYGLDDKKRHIGGFAYGIYD